MAVRQRQSGVRELLESPVVLREITKDLSGKEGWGTVRAEPNDQKSAEARQ